MSRRFWERYEVLSRRIACWSLWFIHRVCVGQGDDG